MKIKELTEKINAFSLYLKAQQENDRILLQDSEITTRVRFPADTEVKVDMEERFIDIEADNFYISIYKTLFSITLL